MTGEKITIDKLAMMIQGGFAEVYEKMDAGFAKVYETMDIKFAEVYKKMATKEDLNNLRKELRFEFKKDLFDMEERVLMRTDRRIGKLEDDMQTVKTKLKLI